MNKGTLHTNPSFVSALMAVMLVFVLSSCSKEEEAAVCEGNKTEPQFPTGINLSPAWADTLYHDFMEDTTWDDTIDVLI